MCEATKVQVRFGLSPNFGGESVSRSNFVSENKISHKSQGIRHQMEVEQATTNNVAPLTIETASTGNTLGLLDRRKH